MVMNARLASHKGMISLRELQSATGEELRQLFFAMRTLMPSHRDTAQSVLRPHESHIFRSAIIVL